MDIKKALLASEDHDYQPNPWEQVFNLGIAGGTAYGFNKLLDLHIPKKGFDPEKLRYLGGFTIGGKQWHEVLRNGSKDQISPTGRMYFANMLKGVEEKMFKIPRTFGLSNLYMERLLENTEISFTGAQVRSQAEYLKRVSGFKLTNDIIKEGLLFKNGKLYDKAGNVVLGHAVVSPIWLHDVDGVGYTSSVLKQHYEKLGISVPKDTDFLILGAKKGKGAFALDRLSAYATKGFKDYLKLLDDPFELIESLVENTAHQMDKTSILKKGSAVWEKVGLKNLFGVGGYKNLKNKNISQLLKTHATRGIPLLAFGMLAYKTIDEGLRDIPIINETGLGGGISGLFASAVQKVSMFGTAISDMTGLTNIAKQQEDAAPGSTSIMGLASIPLGFGIAGATYASISNDLILKTDIAQKTPAPKFFKGLIDHIEDSSGMYAQEATKFMKNRSRTGAFFMGGAILGALAVSPFILGALGSTKDVDELQAIYSGEQEVAIKKGRFWEAGTSPWEGREIDYFAPHWTVRAQTDARRKGILPADLWGKPLTRMVMRVLDPHYLEKKIDSERPYTFWGPTDHGLGFIEKLAKPVFEIFKPTVLAHPEGLGNEAGVTMGPKRINAAPESLDKTNYVFSTSGYQPEINTPDSLEHWAYSSANSTLQALGLQGFVAKSVLSKFTGSKMFLQEDAVYDDSGRIMSDSRAYWDKDLGGLGGSSEWMRRLAQKRDYGTEYVSAPIRNEMPSWMVDELKMGDPYASIKGGELRLPGRGMEALYPELRGVDLEEYPDIFKLKVLNDVAPYSTEYNRAMKAVQDQIAEGGLNDTGVNLFNEILRQRQEIDDQPYTMFDEGEGAMGQYWLGLKKLGRSLPTESLYPFSPVHKFAGPVDAYSDYKSNMILDNPYKQWHAPLTDYVRPAVNRTLDMLSLGNYVPSTHKDYIEIERYFDRLQAVKNIELDKMSQQYAASGDFEAASYFQRGKRDTLYGSDQFEDKELLAMKMPKRDQNYFLAFSNNRNHGEQEKILKVVSPEMQEALKSQWLQNELMETPAGMDKLLAYQKTAPKIGEMSGGIDEYNYPGKDFLGYAPGVNLNALKVKTVDHLGKKIRDHALWREDERQAMMYDSIMNSSYKPSTLQEYSTKTRQDAKNELTEYTKQLGMTGHRITATPITGSSVVDYQGNSSRDNLKQLARQQGMVV